MTRATPRRAANAPSLRRDLADEFAGLDGFEQEVARGGRGGGLRVRVPGGIPRTVVGRVLAGVALVGALGACVAGIYGVERYLLHNQRFFIASSSAIQILGNSHLTRPQLLSVFGEDVDRNILTVPLADRRAELERLPWVEHATVMRLLPDRLRVSIVERTPVAFVRNGGHIGLVDKSGVLLDMTPEGVDSGKEMHYSFPVVTGLTPQDAPSTRAARMTLYKSFTQDLDSSGVNISDKLSEVDLSNPEDVKALIPEGSSEILVHFGEDHFLERYRKFEQNLPKWKTDYPKLASADMRYDRQVVLEMQPGSAAPSPEGRAELKAEARKPEAVKVKPAAKASAKPIVKAAVKPVAKGKVVHPVVVRKLKPKVGPR